MAKLTPTMPPVSPVFLLGDSAHAMLPYLGQGAAMAIEDSCVLSAAIARHADDLDKALLGYERVRVPRARAAVLRSRERARENHLASPWARFKRDVKFALRERFGRDLVSGRVALWLRCRARAARMTVGRAISPECSTDERREWQKGAAALARFVTPADLLARIAHDPQHVCQRQLAGCGCFLPHLLVCTAGRSLGTASARPFSTVSVHRVVRLSKPRCTTIRYDTATYGFPVLA